jgi:hypothetical protein
VDELETGSGGADDGAGEMLTSIDLDRITRERESGLASRYSMAQLNQSAERNNFYAE